MFPLNITFYKHVRRCRRLKKDISKSRKKQENQEELLGKITHKKN
jgi:hypothetical protein